MTRRFETISVDVLHEHVLRVTIDRPQAANAVNSQMGRDLLGLFTDLATEPGATRCVLLTGAGERAFCAGGDLKERNTMDDAQWQAQHRIYEAMIRAVIDCPIPILCAVNGAAYGGGLEIALGCDFIYASTAARFALTEVTLGIMPGCGGTQNLPRAVGERRAKELILTGAPFTAAQGLEWGLVNRVCEAAALLTEATETALRIARNAPLSTRQAKLAIHHGLEQSLANGLVLEIQAYNHLVPSEDRREGVAAFNEKRTPYFKGR
jgi:enoyl-CoA hydratase/carnithine racemase